MELKIKVLDLDTGKVYGPEDIDRIQELKIKTGSIYDGKKTQSERGIYGKQ